MGNTQPQLFEVAELIRGHLRICTMAKHGAQQPAKIMTALQNTRTDRARIAADIETSTFFCSLCFTAVFFFNS